jgi:trans-aconitate methyltransferase
MEDRVPQAGSTTVQQWNTAAYAANGRFVATLASAVVGLLHPQPGERILDVGCGDGALTADLARSGAHLRGVDASPAMVEAARTRGLQVDHHSATELPYRQQFDAVFSNAALHWVPRADQPRALDAIHRALVPGGRFVAEMGGQGNIAAIRTALQLILKPHGIDAEATASSFFPSPAEYLALLESAGFTVDSIELHPRPTPLPGGADGMANWLNTFRNGVLDRLEPEPRSQAIAEIVATLSGILSDATGNWTADYVRLRFHSMKKATPSS